MMSIDISGLVDIRIYLLFEVLTRIMKTFLFLIFLKSKLTEIIGFFLNVLRECEA